MNEAIVACSTPQGKGGIAIVRMSGINAGQILMRVMEDQAKDLRRIPRKLCRTWIVDQRGNKLDEVLVVFFPAPHTYTGEDMVEVHCHGGEAVVKTIVEELVKAGARPALRGEFTRRSFESGKMDLSKAEGVLKLIEAASREEVKGAAKALSGEFGDSIRQLKGEMMEFLIRMEAAIDFPEDTAEEKQRLTDIVSTIKKAEYLRGTVKRGYRTHREIVLAGRPNVGKSSLMNAMARRKVSIVTREPGTTRDAVSTNLLLGGMKITMVDTAGIVDREFSGEAERESDRVAREKIKNACLLVWVADSSVADLEEQSEQWPQNGCPVMWVVNKSDLIEPERINEVKEKLGQKQRLLVSAKTGQGLDKLEERIVDQLIEEYGPPDGVPVTVRQEDVLMRMNKSLQEAAERIKANQLELAAEDVRVAIKEAGGILGEELDTEEILDRIFKEFCIGK